jgi:hypothetical protein
LGVTISPLNNFKKNKMAIENAKEKQKITKEG